jgi:hypothetical protein
MALQIEDIEVREFRPGDEEAILEAFNRIFPQVDPTFVPRGMDEWAWRYRKNPAGWRIWVALAPDGQVIAHQGGVPIRLDHNGERVRWNQIVDSFADPKLGRGLKKPGLFVMASKPFCDTYGGAPPKDEIMYGMPVRRAYRIGQKFLGYNTVRNQNQLRLPLERLRAAAAPLVEVTEVDEFPEEIDAFSARASASHGAVAVRDKAFLDWRFVQRPGVDYRQALARGRGGEILGYAVAVKGSFDLNEGELVCDWLVDPAHPEAGHALRAWLVERARDDAVGEVIAILPEFCPDFAAFQRSGFRVHPTGYYLAAGSFFDGFHTVLTYDDWYYTLAEFDLC